MTAPDLWHNLPEAAWQRVQLLHVPQKMLKDSGEDSKAWLQYVEAKMAAKHRAAKEAPLALAAELKEDDRKRASIYEAAIARITAVLGDPRMPISRRLRWSSRWHQPNPKAALSFSISWCIKLRSQGNTSGFIIERVSFVSCAGTAHIVKSAASKLLSAQVRPR